MDSFVEAGRNKNILIESNADPLPINQTDAFTIINFVKFFFSIATLYIMCTAPFIPFNYIPHSCKTRWLQSSLNISRAVNAAMLFMSSTTPAWDP
jgi:hypothetical protein